MEEIEVLSRLSTKLKDVSLEVVSLTCYILAIYRFGLEACFLGCFFLTLFDV